MYLRYNMHTATPPAAERVYEHVKHAILDRTYQGGRLLTEGEVADEVGVSRTPVREALLRLEAEGLIQLYPKKGALVLPVSADEVDDVLEARELIETHAASKVGARYDAALVPALRELLDQMRTAAAAGDPTAFMAADRGFHEALVRSAGNALLSRFYESLRDRQLRMGVETIRFSPDRMTTAIDEHGQMLAALEAGDPTRLRALAETHVHNASGYLRSMR